MTRMMMMILISFSVYIQQPHCPFKECIVTHNVHSMAKKVCYGHALGVLVQSYHELMQLSKYIILEDRSIDYNLGQWV